MTVHKLLIDFETQVTTFTTGRSFPTQFLTDSIKDVETALFFAKVYSLAPQDVALVLKTCVPSLVVEAFVNEADAHSTTLQDYLVDEFLNEDGEWEIPDAHYVITLNGGSKPPHAVLLPEMWKNLELVIAESIAKVAETITNTISHLPSKTGQMVFQNLAKVNARRPTLGDYRAGFMHTPTKKTLVVFDVSGSMSEPTVRTIVDDVVALAYEAEASLAIVSNTTTLFEAGSFTSDMVLDAAEFGGTRYETLVPLFKDESWDVVVTIADYDSSPAASVALRSCSGRIGQLLDVSLVNRSTYLATCLTPLADEVRPLLVANSSVDLLS